MKYLIIFLFSFSVSATQYYVRTDGNNGNSGLVDSAGGAWLTIQKAADTMVAGDTVMVGSGTFAEAVTTKVNGTLGSPITFQGSGLNSTIIRSFGIDHQFNYIDNFKVVAGSVVYGGVTYYTNNLRITRIYIDNVIFIPIRMIKSDGTQPDAPSWPTNIYIAQCTITNCNTAAKSIEFTAISSILESNYVTSNMQDFLNGFGANNIIRYNVVTNILWDSVNVADPNHNDFVQFEDPNCGAPCASFYCTNITFQGNLAINCISAIAQFQPNAATNRYNTYKFYNNVFVNFTFNTSAGAPNCQWINNVFYKCAQSNGFASPLTFYPGDSQFNSNPGLLRNNVFYGCSYQTNIPTAYGTGYTNSPNSADYDFMAGLPVTSYASLSDWWEPHIVNGGNPLFIDIDNGNARLASGSPLINTGTNMSSYFTNDAAGTTRSGTWDIGAFEFTDITVNPTPGRPKKLKAAK